MVPVKIRPCFAILLAALLSAVPCGLAQEDDRGRAALPKTSDSAPPPEQRVDINHATLDQLLKVPGLTRGWAIRIVRYRPYLSKQDLVEQGVLPFAVYARIVDFIIAHRDKS